MPLSARASQRDLSVKPKASTEAVPITGEYWALIVGIDSYQFAPPLETAVRDVEALRDILIERYGYQRERIIELLNDQATRTNIEDALYQLGRQASAGDSVFIYYAGHGQYDEEGSLGWWVPVDGRPKNPGTFITNASIRDYIRGMKAQHVYLVADSCFSGTLFGTRALPPIDDRFYAKLFTKRSRWALTSGGTEPVADKGREGHSAFAYHFLTLLRENTTPFLIPSRIFDQLAPVIANNADQTPRSEPLRGAGDEGGQFVFRLARSADGAGSEARPVPRGEGTGPEEAPRPIDEARARPSEPPQRVADGVWVTATGAVPFSDETSLRDAKSRSREEARRKAVEGAVEMLAREVPLAGAAKVGDELSRSLVRGTVVEERLLDEGIQQSRRESGAPSLEYVTVLRAKVRSGRLERKADFKVKAVLNKEVFREGEEMVITVTASRPGYVHIFNIAQDEEVTALLPNRLSQHNYVEAPKDLVFPDEATRASGIRLRVFLPPTAQKTSEKIKIIATARNVDLIKGRIREGVYQVYSANDRAFVGDLLKELGLMAETEWAEATVNFEVKR